MLNVKALVDPFNLEKALLVLLCDNETLDGPSFQASSSPRDRYGDQATLWAGNMGWGVELNRPQLYNITLKRN